MDLKTAFPSSKLAPFIIEDALKRLCPLSIFLEKQNLTPFVVKILEYIGKHRDGDFDDAVTNYIDETKSLFEILLKFRNENENFLLPAQLNSLYKIILLKPMLDNFAVNKDGTINQYAFAKSSPVYGLLNEDEIISFTDMIDLQRERIPFDQNDLSMETRILYYTSLLNEGRKFIERFRRATAVSHETLLTLDCLSRTFDGLHHTIPTSSSEITIQNFIGHFQRLPRADDKKVTFISDWLARPPQA
jgi:hypothetical protein